MIDSEGILLVLCLWSCIATGLATHYYRQQKTLKKVVIVMGLELVEVAMGEMTLSIVDDRIVRTKTKEKANA